MSAKNPAEYIQVNPALDESRARLEQFARELDDLRPFWRQLGEHLAAKAQARWPLRRRSGRLRRSLTWAGSRLGRGGIYKATSNALTIGSRIFYSGFHQYGAKNLPARTLVHVDEQDTAERLATWARERATASGLEVL